MSLIAAANAYIDKDFLAIRRRLFALLKSVFPEWTDDTLKDITTLIVELFSWVADILFFYQDRQAREAFLKTAQLRKSVLNIVKLVGYKPTGQRAGTVVETFSLAAAAAGPVTLVKGTKVYTAEITTPVAYQLLADLVIPAGTTSTTATVEHSEFQQDIALSTNLPNQSFVLRRTPFIEGTAVLTAADGEYVEVEDLIESGASDRHFTATIDANNRVTIRTGNGSNGAIPQGTVTIDYKTGGGATGRLDENTLTKLPGSFTDSFGNPVTISVTNAGKTSGAQAQETIAHIKQQAPRVTRVQARAVSREDYEIAAEAVPGVARALHLDADTDEAVPENEGFLYIVPEGGGAPTQALLDLVRDQFESTDPAVDPPFAKTNTYQLSYVGGQYTTVNIQAVIYLRKGAVAATVKAAILADLATFFAIVNEDGSKNDQINFGYYIQDIDGNPTNSLPWSDLFNVVRDATGVLKVDGGATGFLLNDERADVELTTRGFPVQGTVTLIDGLTGLTM